MKSFLNRYWLLVIAVIYLVLPVDILPDSLPLVGNLDDSIIVLAGLFKEYILWKREQEEKE